MIIRVLCSSDPATSTDGYVLDDFALKTISGANSGQLYPTSIECFGFGESKK